MGYGLKTGIWNGKKTFHWRLTEGALPPKLDEAFSGWGDALGLRFEQVLVENTTVDFKVKGGAGSTGWSPALRQLGLKDGEPLGVLLHEVGHLLGLSHEQDRADARDAFYAKQGGASWHLEGAVSRAANLQDYGKYDAASIMLYPDTNYKGMTKPSAGDLEAAKGVNGW